MALPASLRGFFSSYLGGLRSHVILSWWSGMVLSLLIRSVRKMLHEWLCN